jgi:hypothetical protein
LVELFLLNINEAKKKYSQMILFDYFRFLKYQIEQKRRTTITLELKRTDKNSEDL